MAPAHPPPPPPYPIKDNAVTSANTDNNNASVDDVDALSTIDHRLATLSTFSKRKSLPSRVFLSAFEFKTPASTPVSSGSRSARMRYILAWAYLPRPTLSEAFVFEPTARLIAMSHPDTLSDERAYEQTMAWLQSRTPRTHTKASVVTGIQNTMDPSNPDLPIGLECTNCHKTNTRLATYRAAKDGEPELHTWQCLNAVNAQRNTTFPCEACIVCHHSLDLWDHLYHVCDRMKAAGLPPTFLRPNYERSATKHATCTYCGWGPKYVTCKCS